jgi:hypothetical protein
MKKHSYEFIKSEFEKRGWVLLSTEYIDSNQKLDFICDRGHKHQLRYSHFKSGAGCFLCAHEDKRTKLNDLKEEVESEGYQLLTTNYKDSKQKLNLICPEGHKISMSKNSWRNGSRCGVCYSENRCESIDNIRKSFEKEGYILLSTKYKDPSEKLKFICPKGHHHEILWTCWKQGQRCGRCIGNKLVNIDIVRERLELENYTLISTEYKNVRSPLITICSEGHQYITKMANWINGCRCPKCYRLSIYKYYSEEEIEEFHLYNRDARNKTYRIYNLEEDFINPLGLIRGNNKDEAHLDHRVSVAEGFKNKILTDIISNPYNLEMLSPTINWKKKANSSITLKELYIGYDLYQFYKEIGWMK